MREGWERFGDDARREIDLDDVYNPYPVQARYHASPAPYNFLGGAAGPGKSLAMLMENLTSVNEFNVSDGPQVHTLMLRRTQPKVRNTLVTRFDEKVPKELYRSFNRTSLEVTWLNGATTSFGSMQYESNVWDWQGQWYRIFFDELCEFTFKQWNAISAWNRCPVSPYTRKDGAGNPIGIGSGWVKKLFVDGIPPDEMEQNQRLQFDHSQYAYFPCTYLDNPIYATDPQFLAQLESYPEAIRNALKFGSWDVAGGYFMGAWDPALNVYKSGTEVIKPWNRRWISCDWGFEHWAACYWHYMDDDGIIRTYRELMVKQQAPEQLAESIAKASFDVGSDKMPRFDAFTLSHDAFASKNTATMGQNANPVAARMAEVMTDYGLPAPTPSTRDRLGREQLMYQLLRNRKGENAPEWQIADCCKKLIEVIPAAVRDEKNVEMIAPFLGDDPLQGSSYGLYTIVGGPRDKPLLVQRDEAMHKVYAATADIHAVHMADLAWQEKNKPLNWNRRRRR